MKALIASLVVSVFTFTSSATACTYKQALNKLMEVNNMMQVHNRKFAVAIQKGQEPNPAQERIRQSLGKEAAAVGIILSKESDKNPNIQNGSKINPVVCAKYDLLMKRYAPAGYKVTPIKQSALLTGQNKNSNKTGCTPKNIWDRYGVVIKKQSELTKQRKITKKENGAYMILMTQFGQYSTTDINKACVTLSKIESKLAAE